MTTGIVITSHQPFTNSCMRALLCRDGIAELGRQRCCCRLSIRVCPVKMSYTGTTLKRLNPLQSNQHRTKTSEWNPNAVTPMQRGAKHRLRVSNWRFSINISLSVGCDIMATLTESHSLFIKWFHFQWHRVALTILIKPSHFTNVGSRSYLWNEWS